MTVPQLRQCATRPFRLEHAIRMQRHGSLISRERSIRLSDELTALNIRPVFAPFLCPGGRWLFTYLYRRAPVSNEYYIGCWDLSQGDLGNDPVAHLKLPYHSNWDSPSAPCPIAQYNPERRRITIVHPNYFKDIILGKW